MYILKRARLILRLFCYLIILTMAQCLINYNFNLSQNFIANIETQETER